MPTPHCILLVDDSPFFLSLERQFLKHTPATILEARSAGAALEIARRYHPSLVFMDIDMPEVDGLACCRHFYNDRDLRAIPVVLIGDGTRPGDEILAKEAGCAGFLAKPLDRHRFLDIGHGLLAGIDQRESRRDCRLPVSVIWQAVVRQGICLDISSGGLFLEIEPQAGKGDLLSLSFPLPDAERTVINLTGRITWVNPSGTPVKENYPPGYGVEFIAVGEAAGIALRRCFVI